MRSVKVGRRFSPFVLSGVAFLCGYLGAAVQRQPRVDDAEFRRFVRRELRQRLRDSVVSAVARPVQARKIG